MAYIEMKNSTKLYHMGSTTITANDNVSFTIEQGELAIILGASGAGKSTVLNILGRHGRQHLRTSNHRRQRHLQLHTQTTHRIPPHRHRLRIPVLQPRRQPHRTRKRRTRLTNRSRRTRRPTGARRRRALRTASTIFPAQLSGGEQQRVAIARAVAKNPKILLCDEPTGALDYNTGKQVLRILQDMSRKKGATVVIVTHNSAIAPIADRVIRMHDGRVSSIEVNEHPMDIEELEW